MSLFTLSIPASSANIGPGFDSVGIALSRYLTLQVSRDEVWEFKHISPFLPEACDFKDHLIYQVAEQTARKFDRILPVCKVIVDSEIPLARGLGSSASAVVAGIELANQLCNLDLSSKEKLEYGTTIEGHPDNVAAALFGGLVIAVNMPGEEVESIQLPPMDLEVIVYIPNFELKTEAARKVLPSHFPIKTASYASGISNLMIASLLAGDYELAGKMMEQDQFHEPYRAELIPDYENIKQEARKLGAFGTVISGAGPTMISFVPKGRARTISEQMKIILPNYQVDAVAFDYAGVRVRQTQC